MRPRRTPPRPTRTAGPRSKKRARRRGRSCPGQPHGEQVRADGEANARNDYERIVGSAEAEVKLAASVPWTRRPTVWVSS